MTTLGVAVPAPGIYYSAGATWRRPATTFRCSRQRATPGFFDGTVCFPTSLLRFPFVASRFCITTVILVVHFYGNRGSRPLVSTLNRLSNLLWRRWNRNARHTREDFSTRWDFPHLVRLDFPRFPSYVSKFIFRPIFSWVLVSHKVISYVWRFFLYIFIFIYVKCKC